MKKVFLLLLFCWCSILSFAQQPDFSGNWILDKNKSKLDERSAARIKSQTITTEQTEKEIKIVIATEQMTDDGQNKVDFGNGAPRIYTFDGKESFEIRNTSIGKVEVAWKAEFKDKQLQLITSHKFNGSGDVTALTTETWTLSESGTVITIKRKSETPNGILLSEHVYRKA